jgi:hypothetical protein
MAFVEPFKIRCKPAGRDDRNRRIKDSPHHGLVDVVIVGGPGKGKGIRLNHEAAKDFARALRDPKHALRADSQSVVHVLHVGNGALVVERRERMGFASFFSLHPAPGFDEAKAREQLRAAALQIAAAITEAATHAEQDIPAVSEQVALDHATLARAGFPLGLTNDPQLLERARQIHNTDDQLRKYIPNSALAAMPTQQATMRMPMPSLKMGPPAPAAALSEQSKTMTLDEQRELLRTIEERIQGG